MALRKGHGKGKGVPRIEVLPADELPVGVPVAPGAEAPSDRGAHGRFAPGNALARRGGHAKAGQTKLGARLGLQSTNDSEFAPYRRSAVSWRRAQCGVLAQTVGGGICGPAPSSLVATAALQLAWSRYFGDIAERTLDAEAAFRASKFGADSRQSLLAAHELCAKEALARKAISPEDPHKNLINALATHTED